MEIPGRFYPVKSQSWESRNLDSLYISWGQIFFPRTDGFILKSQTILRVLVCEAQSSQPVDEAFMNIQAFQRGNSTWMTPFACRKHILEKPYCWVFLNQELSLNHKRQEVGKVGCEDSLDSFIAFTPSLTPVPAHLTHQPILSILFPKQIFKVPNFLQHRRHQPIPNDPSLSLNHLSPALILSLYTATRIIILF